MSERDSDIQLFYLKNLTGKIILYNEFLKRVEEKEKEMSGLCDIETCMRLVLKDLMPVNKTRYIYKEFCPRYGESVEVEIPEDAIGIMHWVDKASDVDIYPVLSWYEPVRVEKGLTDEEMEEMFKVELENMEIVSEKIKKDGKL